MSKKQINKKTRQNSVLIRGEQTFSGPIPHPAILADYNEVVPNAAERIIAMAEKQSKHRIEIEKQVIKNDIRSSHLGKILGFLLALTSIVGSIFLLYLGKNLTGFFLWFGTLGSLVGVFVYGTDSRRKERGKETKA